MSRRQRETELAEQCSEWEPRFTTPSVPPPSHSHPPTVPRGARVRRLLQRFSPIRPKSSLPPPPPPSPSLWECSFYFHPEGEKRAERSRAGRSTLSAKKSREQSWLLRAEFSPSLAERASFLSGVIIMPPPLPPPPYHDRPSPLLFFSLLGSGCVMFCSLFSPSLPIFHSPRVGRSVGRFSVVCSVQRGTSIISARQTHTLSLSLTHGRAGDGVSQNSKSFSISPRSSSDSHAK